MLSQAPFTELDIIGLYDSLTWKDLSYDLVEAFWELRRAPSLRSLKVDAFPSIPTLFLIGDQLPSGQQVTSLTVIPKGRFDIVVEDPSNRGSTTNAARFDHLQSLTLARAPAKILDAIWASRQDTTPRTYSFPSLKTLQVLMPQPGDPPLGPDDYSAMKRLIAEAPNLENLVIVDSPGMPFLSGLESPTELTSAVSFSHRISHLNLRNHSHLKSLTLDASVDHFLPQPVSQISSFEHIFPIPSLESLHLGFGWTNFDQTNCFKALLGKGSKAWKRQLVRLVRRIPTLQRLEVTHKLYLLWTKNGSWDLTLDDGQNLYDAVGETYQYISRKVGPEIHITGSATLRIGSVADRAYPTVHYILE